MLSNIQNYFTDSEGKCPDGKACPDEFTCCPIVKEGAYGCCPYKNALCCLDKIHCCPNTAVCNETTGSCDSVCLTLNLFLYF